MSDSRPVTSEPSAADPWAPKLSMWDAVSLTIGIVVGTSIFVAPRLVFSQVHALRDGLAAWLLGGVLSIFGALVFAELAVRHPRGGTYEYLTQAFGRRVGLAYGLTLLTVILTPSIGAMAFAFAVYAAPLVGLQGDAPRSMLAMTAVLLLTGLNVLGVRVGTSVQNGLTIVKLLGLGLVVAAGMSVPSRMADGSDPATGSSGGANLALAMVFVLYAYGGWTDAACVAAEVHDRRRNIPWALAGGLAAVAAIYLVVNASYARALGFDGLRSSEAPARDVMQLRLGAAGQWFISAVAMASALGAVNGMLFAGSRAAAAIGADHGWLGGLGAWSARRQTPVRAVLLLGSLALLQIFLVGTEAGRGAIDMGIRAMRLPDVPWERYHGGFETLVAGSAPAYWLLILAAAGAYFVLRRRGAAEYTALGFPLTPLVLMATAGFMLHQSLQYAQGLAWLGLGPFVVGLVLPDRLRGSERQRGKDL